MRTIYRLKPALVKTRLDLRPSFDQFVRQEAICQAGQHRAGQQNQNQHQPINERVAHDLIRVGFCLPAQFCELRRALVHRSQQRIEIVCRRADLRRRRAVIKNVERLAVGLVEAGAAFVGETYWTKAVSDWMAALMFVAAALAESSVERVSASSSRDLFASEVRPSRSCWMAACRWSLMTWGSCCAVFAKMSADAARRLASFKTCCDSGWPAS